MKNHNNSVVAMARYYLFSFLFFLLERQLFFLNILKEEVRVLHDEKKVVIFLHSTYDIERG